MNKRWIWVGSIVVWAALVSAGIAGLARYSMTPGQAGRSPHDWPADVPFHPTDRELTLVVSIHPHCPCSRATLAELAKLTARHPGKISAFVLLTKPADTPGDWERGDAFDIARKIPITRVLTDQDGAWAKKFGAATSGQTFAFDASGRLRFSGGMTASRGHEGDNAGSDAIAALLLAGQPKTDRTPVFGCPLGECPER
ncbi:MAG: RedB protein [Anaerolineae bacterium]|nr:RedB protein [Phycisphaerae bacterium]